MRASIKLREEGEPVKLKKVVESGGREQGELCGRSARSRRREGTLLAFVSIFERLFLFNMLVAELRYSRRTGALCCSGRSTPRRRPSRRGIAETREDDANERQSSSRTTTPKTIKETKSGLYNTLGKPSPLTSASARSPASPTHRARPRPLRHRPLHSLLVFRALRRHQEVTRNRGREPPRAFSLWAAAASRSRSRGRRRGRPRQR